MIGVKTRMALFFAVVLGIAGLCVLAVYRQSPEPREKFRPRNLDRTVAEGMRLVLQPAPALVWEGGMRKLDDLLPNFNKVKENER